MSSAKRKKSKHSKKKKSSEKISEVERTDLADDSRQEIVFKYVLTGLLFIYLLYYLFQLYASLDNTYFWADENKHAYISSLISEDHKIPNILPDEMYGEFKWFYPPLFHILNALVISVVGLSALKYFNLILLCIFLLLFYFLIQNHLGYIEAIAASLLTTLTPVLAINGVRFTAEILSMFLTFFSFFFLLLTLENNRIRYAILSGISSGLLLLSKQTGIIITAFYILLLIWLLWKDRKSGKLMIYVLGISAIIYLPYLAWNFYQNVEAFNFLSLFLGNKPEWATIAVKSFQKYDSSIKEFAYLFYKANGIFVVVSLILPLFYFIRAGAKTPPHNYLFFLLLYLTGVMVVWHITNMRHTIILLPLLTFLFAYALYQLVSNKIIKQVVVLVLFVIAFYTSHNMPDYRQKYNAPEEFFPLSKIIKDDGSSFFRTLCIHKFDLLMYTQKPVIWPHLRLNKNPIELLEKQTANTLYKLLKEYQIKYILINFRFVQNTDTFFGRNYPLTFMQNCEKLSHLDKLSVIAVSKSKKFLLLKVI